MSLDKETRTESVVAVTVIICVLIVAAFLFFTIRGCERLETERTIEKENIHKELVLEKLRQARAKDSASWEKEKTYLEKGYIRKQIPDENKFYWAKEEK